MCYVWGSAPNQTSPRAHTYYVDAVQSNNAPTASHPTHRRSLDRVNKAPLQPATVCFSTAVKPGAGQIKARSGSPAGTVFYGAYGEGDKPLLLGSVAMDRADDWQPAGPGLWATAPVRFTRRGVSADLNAATWSLHQEGGAACTMRSPAGGYRLECQSSGAKGNHLQLSVGGIHVREGQSYELVFRAQCSKPFIPAAIGVMKSDRPWTAYAPAIMRCPEIGGELAECSVGFQAAATAADGRITLYLGGALPAGATFEWQPGKLYRVESNQPAGLSVDVGNIIFDHGAAVGVKR